MASGSAPYSCNHGKPYDEEARVVVEAVEVEVGWEW